MKLTKKRDSKPNIQQFKSPNVQKKNQGSDLMELLERKSFTNKSYSYKPPTKVDSYIN